MLINTSSPQYQRWFQKANALAYNDPNKFRVFMNLANDKFAGDLMRKRIANLGMAIQSERQKRTLGLAGERLELAQRKQATDIAYREKETGQTLKALKQARTLGYLNLGPAIMSGISKYRTGIEEANLLRKKTRDIYGS